MSYDQIPLLKSNFSPIPEVFINSVLHDPHITREELITSLFCFSQSSGWHNSQSLIQKELIMTNTCLSEAEAINGLAQACKRNTLILLPDNEQNKTLYMLNTKDNKQFIETYYSTSAAEKSTSKPMESILSTPIQKSTSTSTKNNEEISDEHKVDDTLPFGGDDELIPFEDEILPMEDDDSLAMEEELPMEDDDSLGMEEELPMEENEALSMANIPLEDNNINTDQNESNCIPAGMTLPYKKSTVDMIYKILGRNLSKIETERLADLESNDQELIEAMSSLLSKTKKIYSSDLIVYEYEQLQSNRRTSSKYERAKVERYELIEKQKSCMKCGGLGYTFQGLNNVLECDCKK